MFECLYVGYARQSQQQQHHVTSEYVPVLLLTVCVHACISCYHCSGVYYVPVLTTAFHLLSEQ